jgi:hypothetical protein
MRALALALLGYSLAIAYSAVWARVRGIDDPGCP